MVSRVKILQSCRGRLRRKPGPVTAFVLLASLLFAICFAFQQSWFFCIALSLHFGCLVSSFTGVHYIKTAPTWLWALWIFALGATILAIPMLSLAIIADLELFGMIGLMGFLFGPYVSAASALAISFTSRRRRTALKVDQRQSRTRSNYPS